MTQIVLSSGSQLIIPADCVKFDSVECMGAGAQGAAGVGTDGLTSPGNGGYGGGGGAYARRNNVPVTPGSTVSFAIGLNSGGTSWFINGSTCLAVGGNGQLGGNAASCVGDVTVSGNNGVAGGGISSPYGGAGGTGGSGAAPYGGAGGAGTGQSPNYPSAGSPGGAWGGGGGGGGGAGFADRVAKAGGAPGPAYQGVIVLNYTPYISVPAFNMPMLGM
ncbi:hypothetical protein SAMN05444163_8052 [Bradyrhizobium ottawaense]|uniref:PE-PGRS family protein n=1 Tax=Bradyrhizobium ottawaense TaxID=931866 RepID=A0ABY0QHB8_9BRAD|nr:hypothetical protein SAMN05444163_8052 [Bradyrhizobium ottawaense]